MIEQYIYNENGFLEIFRDFNEDGDIFIEIEKNEKISLGDICNSFESSNMGIFSFSNSFTEAHKEKIEFEIIEENGENYAVMKLAPLLGLPGVDYKEELKELESFLRWFKDKALLNVNVISLMLSSVRNEAILEIVSSNDNLSKELSEEMHEIINKSKNLTEWLDNQKKAIIKSKGKLNNLYAKVSPYSIMSIQEQKRYKELTKKEKLEKRVKTRRYGL